MIFGNGSRFVGFFAVKLYHYNVIVPSTIGGTVNYCCRVQRGGVGIHGIDLFKRVIRQKAKKCQGIRCFTVSCTWHVFACCGTYPFSQCVVEHGGRGRSLSWGALRSTFTRKEAGLVVEWFRCNTCPVLARPLRL